MPFSADRQEIVIDPCLSKQNYTERIRLTNSGNLNAEISGIEADEDCKDWLQIVSGHKTFTLLSPDSGARPGPTAFTEYDFKVIVRPGRLKQPESDNGKTSAWNHGKISVYTAQQEHVLEIPVRANVILPKDSEDYIGIDFGTSYSVIAIYDSKKDDTHVVRIHKSPDSQKTYLIPSVLVFEGSHDNYKIGWEAQNEAIVSPELTVRSIRKVLGYGNDREFYGKTFSPEELAGCIIKKLVELAETEYYIMTETYYNIKNAIIIVPANFSDLQIRGILKACKFAGLDTEEGWPDWEETRILQKEIGKRIQRGILIDKPSAATLFYLDVLFFERLQLALEEKLDTQGNVNFLIFDFDREGLDVSIVQVLRLSKGGIGIRVLANKGNNLLGGDSIDLELMRWLLEECGAEISEFDDTIISCNFNELQNRRKKENWNENVWKEVLLSRYYWKKAAEDVKVRLSTETEAPFDTGMLMLPLFYIKDGEIRDIRDERYGTEISRYMFEGWIEGILSDCKQLVTDALGFAGIDADSVDYIIHTGRSSLIPAVRERVRSIFPHLDDESDILNEKHLKVCVARGAAMYGAQKKTISESGVHLIAEGRKLPFSYGIAKLKGTQRIFEEIIPLGSTYPTEAMRHYGEKHITGRILHLTFFQNSGMNQKIRGNPDIRWIGDITTVLPENNPNCDVKFIIDANKMLNIFVNKEPVEIKPERLEDEERWVG